MPRGYKTKAQRTATIEQRKNEIMRLTLIGHTQIQIAQIMGIRRDVVRADFRATVADWARAREEMVDTKLAKDLARTEEILKVLMPVAIDPNTYIAHPTGPLSWDKLMTAVLDYRARATGAYEKGTTLDTTEALAAVFKRAAKEANGEDPSDVRSAKDRRRQKQLAEAEAMEAAILDDPEVPEVSEPEED